MKRKKPTHAAITTLVGSHSRVHGDIHFSGGAHVDGFVKGNIKALDDDQAVLSVSEQGRVEGGVCVPHLLLAGTVKCDVTVTERVELAETARVMGNVQYKLIEMAIGAEVNGKLMHESEGTLAKDDVEVPVALGAVSYNVAGE